jgi:hypothetical protein
MADPKMPRRRLPPHISRIDHARFFASAFGGVRAARQFHDSLSSTGSGPRNRALLIINQPARILWLADRVERLSRGRPALQIMFFMIVAEAVAKLFYAYKGEHDSKKFARRFFLSICTDEHRRRLVEALRESLNKFRSRRCCAVMRRAASRENGR